MPLHLLGKKSWNVYNPESIARVRRDEAAARTENEQRERQSRNDEAEARLRSLRGEEDLVYHRSAEGGGLEPHTARDKNGSSRKRRRLNGEDDTDRDIRLATTDATAASREARADALFNSGGHIDLVQKQSQERKSRHGPEHQNEPVGMRFSDAAGYKSKGKPWYTNQAASQGSDNAINKDIWGNDDPRRQEREQQRVVTNDPLAAMKRGVRQLRENEKQRKEWMEQRERDLYEVERLARRRKRKARRSSDEDSLDEFSLDALEQGHAQSTRKAAAAENDHSHHHRRSRHRAGSRESRHRHRHRHDRTMLSEDKSTNVIGPRR